MSETYSIGVDLGGTNLRITFDREVGSKEARVLLERYLRDLEVLGRATLTCLIVMEQKHYSGLGMPAGRVHFHLLVATTADLTVEDFEDYWNRLPYGGKRTTNRERPAESLPCSDGRGTKKESTSHVQPYDPAISATYYLFKTLHESPDNWELRRQASQLAQVCQDSQVDSPSGSSGSRRTTSRPHEEDRRRLLVRLTIW
jgi:hypothetical protein